MNYVIVTVTVGLILIRQVLGSAHDFSTDNLNIINDGPSNVCPESQQYWPILWFTLFIGGACGFTLLYIFVRIAYFGPYQLGFRRKRDTSSGRLGLGLSLNKLIGT